VTVEDVQNRWRVLDADELRIAPTLITDAQDMVETAAEGLGVTAEILAASDRLKRAYVRVVASMVGRVLKNPEGLLTDTYRRDSAISAGVLYIAPDELASLTPSVTRRRGAFTVTLAP
jgi:hypothetical protein